MELKAFVDGKGGRETMATCGFFLLFLAFSWFLLGYRTETCVDVLEITSFFSL